MAKEIDPTSLWGLCTWDALYMTLFSWLFGQTIYQTFIGGVIAHRALTKHTFAALQSRTFPTYFASSALLSGICLGLWTKANKDAIFENYLSFKTPETLHSYLLVSVVGLSLVNWLWVGPETNKVIRTRQRLERAEGKMYSDPGVSTKMKELNAEFSRWHGISSLANLIVVLALIYHGLWIANFGSYNRKQNVFSESRSGTYDSGHYRHTEF